MERRARNCATCREAVTLTQRTALEAELIALLTELIAIEGPQPGTAGWAAKVQAALNKAESQTS